MRRVPYPCSPTRRESTEAASYGRSRAMRLALSRCNHKLKEVLKVDPNRGPTWHSVLNPSWFVLLPRSVSRDRAFAGSLPRGFVADQVARRWPWLLVPASLRRALTPGHKENLRQFPFPPIPQEREGPSLQLRCV